LDSVETESLGAPSQQWVLECAFRRPGAIGTGSRVVEAAADPEVGVQVRDSYWIASCLTNY